MRHAVIMAGGAGTRLWPLSRRNMPKQLLKLVGGKSLLNWSCERLLAMLPAERVWIIAAAAHRDQILADLPMLPAENVIGEPCGRDTANAIGMAAEIVRLADADATMGVFTADHIIEPIDRFAEIVWRGYDAAEGTPDALVTFGIKPTFAHTGLGYVHRGSPIDCDVYTVEGFQEKPDRETAERYVNSGEYYWNSGMFVWKAGTILGELQRNLPEAAAALATIRDAWATGGRAGVLNEVYPTLPKISIDYAVMEKAAKVLVVEMDCRWVDVGSWVTLAQVIDADAEGNTIAAPRTALRESADNVIVSADDHLVALMGVKDLVVIHSKDATLVCSREHALQLKDLVEMVHNAYPKEYE